MTDVAASAGAPAGKPRQSRPTTPIRRLSSSSLRQSSLSASRSRSTTEAPLQHLGPLFAELADAVSDLSGNIENLANVNKDLQLFNEAFASYLLGLRVNAYTASWESAPTRLNFELAALRRAKEESQQQARHASHPQGGDDSDEGRDTNDGNMTTTAGQESEYSFMARDEGVAATSSTGRGGRGGSTSMTRGGSSSGRGRGRGGKVIITKKERDAQNAFVDSIVPLMPIKFREQEGPQRQETAKVLLALRDHPDGLTMAECNKQTSVPTHRINEAFTALVRAKVALKVVVKGATSYRLDPERYFQ